MVFQDNCDEVCAQTAGEYACDEYCFVGDDGGESGSDLLCSGGDVPLRIRSEVVADMVTLSKGGSTRRLTSLTLYTL